MPHIFSYHYTTASPPAEDSPLADMNHAPLAGFGYGLPLSRLYAKYMGGDLNVISIPSFGTDAYVHLKKLPNDAEEVLPSFSLAAINHYKSTTNNIESWMDTNIV